MTRRLVMTAVLMGACVWGLTLLARTPATAARGDAPAASAGGAFKPVASIHSLMEGQGMHFGALKEALLYDEAGAERFEKLVTHAELLAELANVNTLNRDKEDYQKWAGELRDYALALAAEAKKEAQSDDQRMKDTFSQLNATCSSCHDVYRKD